jgi:hypothetical protein
LAIEVKTDGRVGVGFGNEVKKRETIENARGNNLKPRITSVGRVFRPRTWVPACWSAGTAISANSPIRIIFEKGE